MVTCSLAFAQSKFNQNADSLYQAKAYAAAGRNYLLALQADEFNPQKQNDYYNAACCYALTGKADSAMILLQIAIKKYDYEDVKHLGEDTDLESLHKRDDWQKLVASIHPRQKSTGDPNRAKLITTDINNFWSAYDLAQKDTANRYNIYKKYYVDAGTPGLQDYFAFKVRSTKNFVRTHDKKPKFYAAIRKNTYTVELQKPRMMASFAKLKDYYADALFPDIYFVIGAFTSGGTSTTNGLLIGLDQSVRTPDIPLDGLNLWERNNFADLNSVPYMVAHELIHFNQQHMAAGKSLLRSVLIEGMADFIGELISGKTANPRLHVWAKGHEKQVWADFEKEMYLDRAQNWIANSSQETADKPADLGYWVGYQICKAYYNQSTDKKQAVTDMLNIKDYKAFYDKSGAGDLYK